MRPPLAMLLFVVITAAVAAGLVIPFTPLVATWLLSPPLYLAAAVDAAAGMVGLEDGRVPARAQRPVDELRYIAHVGGVHPTRGDCRRADPGVLRAQRERRPGLDQSQ